MLHDKFIIHVGLPVLEKKMLKVFTIYGRGGHLGHVTSCMTWTIYINFRSLPRKAPHKIWL